MFTWLRPYLLFIIILSLKKIPEGITEGTLFDKKLTELPCSSILEFFYSVYERIAVDCYLFTQHLNAVYGSAP